MDIKEIKVEVINPIGYFNTIGQELLEICETNGLDSNVLLTEIKAVPENGKVEEITKISKFQIKKIEELTQIPSITEYLNSFQNSYLISRKKAEVSFKENHKIYKKVKFILPLLNGEFNDGIDLLEDISEFLDIDNEKEIFQRVNENIALYRISNFEPDNLNLYAWLRRGELDFYKLDLPNYNKDSFLSWIDSLEWKSNLYNIDYLLSLPNLLRNFGVGLVFTPYLNKTVHGAVRWFNGKPLIQISDKNKCLTTVWYTLFHEFGHVILHENDEVFEGNLDLPQSKINKKEKEANSFAYHYLFNGDGLRKYIFSYRNGYVDPSFLSDVSRKFNVDTMFVAYWMKKAQIKSTEINRNLPAFTIQ